MKTDFAVFTFDITDSTNLRAKEYIVSKGSLPALFIANEQTAGRGRLGRSFYSPKNSGLYMTLALAWDNAFKEVALTSVVSVALVRTLEKFTDKKLSIKWVNDILADEKKVAGILCERVAESKTNLTKAVIIGIGVNLTTTVFPDEISASATNLSEKLIDRRSLALDISNEIISVLVSTDTAALMNEYRGLSAVIGKNICYIKNGVKYEAFAEGIDNSGGLEIVHPNGIKATLTSGEITIRFKKTD